MDLQGKEILVVGAGKSGIAASAVLARIGAKATLFDGNASANVEKIKEDLGEWKNQVTLCIGEISEDYIPSALLLSPGVPVDSDFVKKYSEKGIPLIGEIELGFLLEKGKVIAITGTNGKTTTTTLVGDIMKAYYEKVFVVGNIGNPYTLEALDTTADSVTVGEISSFQLETTDTFHPVVSAILNITPDHLNRHHTMEGYILAKERISLRQTKEDVCVLNYDNEYTRDFGNRTSATPVFFSSKNKLENGYFLDGDTIKKATDGIESSIMNIHDMNLVGMCNVENVMAAIAISTAMGVPMDNILSVIHDFKAVEHRIEFVATKKGVDYYNDSKGTNPDAAIQGIKAMTKPTILIGGGYDKGSEYDEWIEAFDGKVKLLVLIGQTREKIAECAKAHDVENIVFADTYEECLKICTDSADPGDAVLLSPACASWGMFPNYEIRGTMFKDYVRGLKD